MYFSNVKDIWEQKWFESWWDLTTAMTNTDLVQDFLPVIQTSLI